jgi:hypothetical protein
VVSTKKKYFVNGLETSGKKGFTLKLVKCIVCIYIGTVFASKIDIYG